MQYPLSSDCPRRIGAHFQVHFITKGLVRLRRSLLKLYFSDLNLYALGQFFILLERFIQTIIANLDRADPWKNLLIFFVWLGHHLGSNHPQLPFFVILPTLIKEFPPRSLLGHLPNFLPLLMAVVIIIIKPMIKLGLVPNFIILAKKPILNCFVGCYHLEYFILG